MTGMADILSNVTVIGAGLGGCALALALAQRNIPVTVYESRPEVSPLISSGVVLTPNGLKILDRMGVLARIEDRCYAPKWRYIKNDNDENIEKSPAGEPDGYCYHRVWRGILLDEMKAMLKEHSVRISYESKFGGIVSDTEQGVSFLVNDGVMRASLVIGSDGIYSTLRQYIAPGIVPQYTGIIGVLSHIRRDSVAWPYEDYEKNATIQSKPGAIFWVAEDPDGTDLMIGKQQKYPEQSREDLDRLQADKDKLASFYLQDYDQYGSTARKVIDSVCRTKENLFIWPYMKMPEVKRWYSDTGRVILVGDGAHALPPSSGQGINQALEDVFSLSLTMTAIDRLGREGGAQTQSRHELIIDGLSHWQKIRQERIDAVFEWTNNTANVQRLPEAERNQLIAEGKIKKDQGNDLTWLFNTGIEEKVDDWIKAHSG